MNPSLNQRLTGERLKNDLDLQENVQSLAVINGMVLKIVAD